MGKRGRIQAWRKRGRKARERLRERLGMPTRKPIIIQPYHGFGTSDFVYVSGRVLRDRQIIREQTDGVWRNFYNTYKRFVSRELANVALEVTFAGECFTTRTDEEGYFIVQERLSQPLTNWSSELSNPWQAATVQLVDSRFTPPIVKTPADVLVPGPQTSFGIISDIDDTILKTYVTSWLKWRMIYLSIWQNAFSRQAFTAVAPFFQALRRGPTGESYNPFFYVSNSPWNIYDQLEDFLRINELPRGPIMLRDFGLPYEQQSRTFHGTKRQRIERILQLYPELSFVLIGDSGERDVDIYQAIFDNYPGRILAIYIRDVRSVDRAVRVQKILDQLPIPNLLVPHYRDAARHAAQHGLLDLTTFKTV
ncbi:MAG: phosphatase domain-containing protein [Bacteroidota bacterium]